MFLEHAAGIDTGIDCVQAIKSHNCYGSVTAVAVLE